MNKKSLRDVELKGRRVLMRVDFNVPIKDGRIGDDTRVRAALPSIEHILQEGGSVVLMSHLGRPKGKGYEAGFSLAPVAAHLEKLLGKPVQFGPDCLGDETLAQARDLQPGEVLLVENTRFYAAEDTAKAEMKEQQKDMARKLAMLGDGEVFCNDAFGTAHRAHASTAVVCEFHKQNVAGFLMQKEIDFLGRALSAPERPFVAILGGAKVSDKVNVITNLLSKVDALIIGGAMAYTFYRAKGLPTGTSLVEEDKVELARDILAQAEARQVPVLLPIDHVVAARFDAAAQHHVVGETDIPDDWMALDIGPRTALLYTKQIAEARTIVWNGPMGAFEMDPFSAGTTAVARAVANAACLSIVGGGDSVAAVNQAGLADRMAHMSTGGGASLEFLEGKTLPGVAALSDKT